MNNNKMVTVYSDKSIVSITGVEVVNEKIDRVRYIGYVIKTDDGAHDVSALIEHFQSCCETYGTSVSLMDADADTDMCTQALIELPSKHEVFRQEFHARLDHVRERVVGQHIVDVKWKDLSTDRNVDPQTNTVMVYVSLASGATLCLRLFNEHNGYYEHLIRLKWFDFQDNENRL